MSRLCHPERPAAQQGESRDPHRTCDDRHLEAILDSPSPRSGSLAMTLMKTTPTTRALMLMTASATFFGLMAFSAKLASARLSGPQVAMIRFAIGLLPPLLVPRYRRAATHFQRLDLLFLRGFFGGIAALSYFIAIAHINVGVATLLNYTAPIFSGAFSMLFIGEKISPKVLLPMPLALFGVFLVVHAHAR